jgi:polyhydroxyalkanoate synthase subunit PhaE
MTADRQEKSLVPGLDGFFEAWTTALRTSETGGGPVELAMRLLDPRNWLGVGGAALEQPFETVLGLPRLADVPDLDRKLLNLLHSWASVAQRGAEYGAMVSRVWMAAYVDFLPTLQAAALTGKPVPIGRELLDRWTAMVNERLLKIQRSDDFLETQRRLLDALLKSRAAEHELVEIGAKAADLPTRAEMDDVHKTLHAVKRELRELQRRLAAAEEAGAASGSRLKLVAGTAKTEGGQA